MRIPFHKPHITDKEIDSVTEVLKSGWLTMGEKTLEFEKRFRAYIGVKHAVAVNSATSALHCALAAAGLREGDEVLLPAMTFVATAEVVLYFKAIPVMVDVNRETHLMEPHDLERKISPKSRAVIPVHYAGQMCDMDAIQEIARRHHLVVIEDAAHALPAWYRGAGIGSGGGLCCFSFYATKTLVTGEGGMITTDSDELADRMSRMRLHGIGRDSWNRYSDKGSWEYDVTMLGYKYNTTDINAALGIEQLEKLEWMWKVRCDVAGSYERAFSSQDPLIPYRVVDDRVCAWHLYPLKLNLEALSISRDGFITELKNRGIGTSVHYIPLPRFSYYRDRGYRAGDYPGAEWVYERVVSLPIYPGMEEKAGYIAECVTDIASKNRR